MTDGFTPAQRGFIAITITTRRGYSMIAGSYCYTRHTVGTVTSVSREGEVKRVKPASLGCDMTPRDWDKVLVLDPAMLTDPAAFLAECEHRQSTDADKYRPFDSLQDVRDTAKKYAKPELLKAAKKAERKAKRAA